MSPISVAVVDDDPVELTLLTEIAADVAPEATLAGFSSVDAFVAADVSQYALVLLDRRIPPYRDYAETLPMLADAGYDQRVVLMTAHDPGLEVGDYPFSITGPVDKLDLLKPEVLKAVLTAGTLPRRW